MIQHLSPISGISAFKEKWVATAGYDNQVILWDAHQKKSVGRIWHDHLANQCAFSPCGLFLATASSDGTARIFSVPDLKLKAFLGDHEDDVEVVSFHPSRPLIATASRDRHVRVFGMDGKLIVKFKGHAEDVNSVDWIHQSLQLVSSSDDGTIKCWDMIAGGLVENINMEGVQTDTVVFGRQGSVYAGNDAGEMVAIIGGKKRTTKAHDAGIKRLVYHRELGLLASMSYDRTLKVWNVNAEGELSSRRTASLPSIIWPRSCAFQGTDTLVFGTFGTSYASYNFETDTWLTEGVNPTWGCNAVAVHQGDIFSVGDAGVVFKNSREHQRLGSLCNFLTSFGEAVLTGGQLGIVLDAIRNEKIYEHRSPLNCGATFMKEGRPHAIIGTYTGEGLIFSIDGQKVKFETVIQLHENAVKGVACSEECIFSVCATGAAAFHRIDNFRLESAFRHGHDKIANGCVRIKGNQFASVSRDRKLRIWDAASVSVISTPHTHSIKCIAASLDGNFIATGDYHGTVAIFDRMSGQWRKVERPTASGISTMTTDADGNFLASSYDGHIYTIAT